MLAVDETRTATVRLLRTADSGFAIECVIPTDGEPPAVHGPVPLAFSGRDDRAAVDWFATCFGEPPLDVYRALTGPIIPEPDASGSLPLPPLQARSVTVTVPTGLILPVLRALGPAETEEGQDDVLQVLYHSPVYQGGGERWLRAEHGPGILENSLTGETLAYERLRLIEARRTADGPHHGRAGWVIGARAVEVVPIGGPTWTLALTSAPTGIGDDDDDMAHRAEGAREDALHLETRTGSFVCRAPRAGDLTALSRVAPHLPDGLALDLGIAEVRLILSELARTSAAHRDADGRLDWDGFRAEVIASERVEVLVDEYRSEIRAVRYRRLVSSGGAILRTLEREEESEAKWADPSRSLWELARVGWTPEETIAMRPHLTELFAPAWLGGHAVAAAAAAGDLVADLRDIELRSPSDRDSIVDALVSMLARLDERIVEIDERISEALDELSTVKPDEYSMVVHQIDDLTAERDGLELEQLRWRRWTERGQPDELPMSMDALVRLLLAESFFDE